MNQPLFGKDDLFLCLLDSQWWLHMTRKIKLLRAEFFPDKEYILTVLYSKYHVHQAWVAIMLNVTIHKHEIRFCHDDLIKGQEQFCYCCYCFLKI
jgi:hypothetical protein